MEAIVLIGALIAGATQAIKLLSPAISGILTVVVAVVVGIVIAVVDTSVGVMDISIAQGIVIALSTVGVVSTVDRV